MTPGRLHVVLPDGYADPGRPSGGNGYDRRACAGLAGLGWDVRVATVAGSWPAGDHDALTRVLTAIPDGETVLIDGLIASPSAAALLPHAHRLRLTVLLHMPLATAGPYEAGLLRSERVVLGAARGVVVTSAWTREQVLDRFALPAGRVHVARPGVEPARLSPMGDGRRLLCVGAVAPHKCQDLLVDALAGLPDGAWECTFAGPLDRAPAYAARLRSRMDALGLGARIHLPGTLTGAALDRAYASADLLVVPSRTETYGMVVTEALARGVPVLTSTAGGLPEALGHAPDGARPGLLVPPDDPPALTAALAQWLRDASLRHRLRTAAVARRPTLAGWDATAAALAAALTLSGP